MISITMIARHAGKHRASVLRALAAAGIKPQKLPGARGLRLPEREVNKFLARQWPEVGPLPSNP